MPFSNSAESFFREVVLYVETYHINRLGDFLVGAYTSPQEGEYQHSRLVRFRDLFKRLLIQLFEHDSIWSICPEDMSILWAAVYDAEVPPEATIGCRAEVVYETAKHFTEQLQILTPEAAVALHTIQEDLDDREIRRLIKDHLLRCLDPKGLGYSKLAACVGGRRKKELLATSKEEEESPRPLQQQRWFADPPIVGEDIAVDTTVAPKFDYYNAAKEAFRSSFGDTLMRPFLAYRIHSTLNNTPVLVIASMSGVDAKGQPVYAGCKYTDVGGEERMVSKLSPLLGPAPLNMEGHPVSSILAVPWVEGGFGKFWINKKDDTRGDLLSVFFVTIDGRIHTTKPTTLKDGCIVAGKDLYHTQRKVWEAKRKGHITPPRPVLFDV